MKYNLKKEMSGCAAYMPCMEQLVAYWKLLIFKFQFARKASPIARCVADGLGFSSLPYHIYIMIKIILWLK